MKQMLKMELGRAFKGKMLYVAIAMGSIVTLLQYFLIQIWPMIENPANVITPEQLAQWILYPTTVFYMWIGGVRGEVYATLYYLLFPILATLPFADSLYVDRRSGYIKSILLRTKKKNYYVAKYISVFLSAGVAVVVPLLLNLALTAVTYPSLTPQVETSNNLVFATSMWAELYYTAPYGYIFAYLAMNFVFAGLLACLAPAVSFFVENRFVVLLTPFLIYLFTSALCGLSTSGVTLTFSPNTFLNMASGFIGTQFWAVLMEAGVLLALTAGLTIGEGIHSETY